MSSLLYSYVAPCPWCKTNFSEIRGICKYNPRWDARHIYFAAFDGWDDGLVSIPMMYYFFPSENNIRHYFDKDASDCFICFNSIESNQSFVVLPCKHIICWTCYKNIHIRNLKPHAKSDMRRRRWEARKFHSKEFINTITNMYLNNNYYTNFFIIQSITFTVKEFKNYLAKRDFIVSLLKKDVARYANSTMLGKMAGFKHMDLCFHYNRDSNFAMSIVGMTVIIYFYATDDYTELIFHKTIFIEFLN
jgi:hypothetical protein